MDCYEDRSQVIIYVAGVEGTLHEQPQDALHKTLYLLNSDDGAAQQGRNGPDQSRIQSKLAQFEETNSTNSYEFTKSRRWLKFDRGSARQSRREQRKPVPPRDYEVPCLTG